MSDEVSSGERLRRMRVQRGLTQKQVAKAIQMDQSEISRWEINGVSTTGAILLSRFFRCSVDLFLPRKITKKLNHIEKNHVEHVAQRR